MSRSRDSSIMAKQKFPGKPAISILPKKIQAGIRSKILPVSHIYLDSNLVDLLQKLIKRVRLIIIELKLLGYTIQL
jgi:hypothetical protein